MNPIEFTFYDNTLANWLLALAIFIVTLVILRTGREIAANRLKRFAEKTVTTLDDLAADLIHRTRFLVLFIISVYAGSLALELPQDLHTLLESIALIAVLLQIAIWGNRLVAYIVECYVELEIGEEATSAASAAALTFIGRVIMWSVVFLLALDNLGFEITALVTGLGIGGIAIALAVQNILGDLFSSVSILLDKPFVVGDFIIVDEYVGSVEYVGLKTTRVRSLSGEQLIFSNSDLLNSRIRNFKRMYERRILFQFGVTYQTPYEKLESIPKMAREIVESQDPVRFDRAHFKAYGASSLDFEVVYWVQSADFNLYMDIQQNINLTLFRRFEEEGIEFAYPTQTLYVNYEDGKVPASVIQQK